MIRKELTPPPPVRPEARHIGQCMRREESVAVGIRLYEESANPEKYARTGRLKTPQEIRQIIEAVRSWRPDAIFYVFCTHRAPLLQQLDLPKSTVWLTQEEGFSDSLESLWLMTNCRHHIITNSTFYWWGAWLSGGTHKDADQRIWAADNFANKDAPSTSWELF